MTASDKQESEPTSPTSFMRQLRPELYSDSTVRSAYQLDATALEYHLESLTSRNQTHEFEIFCRKLCERAICPSLKPATGPEGGGDSKADTETIPIADEVSSLFFSGEANSGKERWAFAFSAKKRWVDKVRSDVAGAIGTGRGYQKVYFVTSQFARAQTRAKLEDELFKQYGVQITILDRTWIVDQVIDKDHKDLAVNYLGVGMEIVDRSHLGAEDYARTQQLKALEKQLSDPTAYDGMKIQRVMEALVAAKLSRGLERPRVETDGRFARAIRLANVEGSHRQQLEAEYESIWTAFWWYDDVALVNSSYEAFEAHALPSEHANELEFLCNLLQLLFTSVRHQHLTLEESSLDERASRLAAKLETLTKDNLRPNNALEARASLLAIRVNQTMLTNDITTLSAIWPQYSSILREAKGLGEFDAERLTKLIEVFGKIAGKDRAYDQLVDDLAAFVSERTSEAQGALILLRRAEQLGFDRNFEMIRLLGRAVPHLTKKEYADSLIEAARLQALAYRSAGLLWAARANCLLALATIFIQAEEDSDLPASVVPTIMLLAWIAVELNHLPDTLDAIRLARGAAASLPLAEDSKTHFEEQLARFDMVVSCVMVNLKDDQLDLMTRFPDVLFRLDLPLSRMWLLYVLGYEAELRVDGWIQNDDSAGDVAELAGKLAAHLPHNHRHRPAIFNGDGASLHSTSVLGLQIDVQHEGTDASILAAELVLTSLEAAFATLPERETVAHTERFSISIEEDPNIAGPLFAIDRSSHSGILRWPQGYSPTELAQGGKTQEAIVRLVTSVLFATCASRNMAETIKRLVDDDSLLARIVPMTTVANSRQRIFKAAVPRLADWDALGGASYGARQLRPEIKPTSRTTDGKTPEGEEAASPQNGAHAINDHRRISTLSVIDVDLWDRANWIGAAFGEIPNGGPPLLALMFRSGDAARSIFERWQARIGNRDEHNTIYIGIAQGVSEVHPAHYRVVVTSLPTTSTEPSPGQQVAVAMRSMTMEPDTNKNLTRFLAAYHRAGCYLLVPAILADAKQPEFVLKLGILKRELSVRTGKEVDPQDFESILFNYPAVPRNK